MKCFNTEFIKEEYDDLIYGKVINYVEQVPETFKTPQFKIHCTRYGMKFTGYMHGEIVTERDLQEFAKLISLAWNQHRKLAPRIEKPGDIVI